MLRLALALLLLAAPAQAEAQAQDTAEAARAASGRLQEAGRMLDEAEGSTDRLSALTQTVHAYEEGLVLLRDGLRRAALREAALERQLASQEGEIGDLLGVLMTIERAPVPLLLLHPSGPVGTARAAMMGSAVTPALQERAEALRADLTEVQELRAVQDSAAATLEEGLAGAQQARAELAQAAQERTDLPRRYTEDPVATALLIAGSETLEAFAGGLAQTIDTEMATEAPDAADRRGSLPLPVQGVVLRGYGQADAAGVERPGLVIATRPQALVTLPVAATLRFRGELLDYGTVAILEPAPGVLFVLAGMAEVYGEAGEVLPEGAPLGLMGGEAGPGDAILTGLAASSGAEASETLYLEVRDRQGPTDPATWFALD